MRIKNNVLSLAYRKRAQSIYSESHSMLFNARLAIMLLIIFSTSNVFANDRGILTILDVPYGAHQRQTFDVYYPKSNVVDAPVIVMVHGGAWKTGDKSSKSVVKNKVSHWVNKGFIFISVNYRLVPDSHPVEQAEDIKKAILLAKKKVGRLGGAADKFILMGHSAGAHLVSLVATRHYADITPWLGTISLDSAAYNIETIMNDKPARFYKKAFGQFPSYWVEASPIHALSGPLPPYLAVCSSKRKGDACKQTQAFVDKASLFNTSAKMLVEAYSHRRINLELGKNACYTQRVDEFIKTLHPDIDSMLPLYVKHSC